MTDHYDATYYGRGAPKRYWPPHMTGDRIMLRRVAFAVLVNRLVGAIAIGEYHGFVKFAPPRAQPEIPGQEHGGYFMRPDSRQGNPAIGRVAPLGPFQDVLFGLRNAVNQDVVHHHQFSLRVSL